MTMKEVSMTDSRRLNLRSLDEQVTKDWFTAKKSLEKFLRADPTDKGKYEDLKRVADHDARLAEEAASRYEQASAIANGRPVQRVEDARAASTELNIPRDESSPYGPGKEASYLKDQYAASRGNQEARERIGRSNRQLRDLGLITRSQERALSETAGSGGELVAPAHLQKIWVHAARVGRPFLNIVNKSLPLVPNTDEVFIPAIEEGGSTAAQTDLEASADKDLKTVSGGLKHRVATVAGSMMSSRQEFERAIPAYYDFAVFPDLTEDYLTQTDMQGLTGSGVAPNLLGVFEVSGTTKVKLESWSLTDPSALIKAFAEAIKGTWDNRKRAPDAAIMHPNRWAAVLSLTDSQKQPLVGFKSFVPGSAPTTFVAGEETEAVGSIMGVPVFLDGNIPTNKGAGTNQDLIVVVRRDDHWYLEEPLVKTRVFDDIAENGKGEVRLQVQAYSVFFPDRYASGISIIEGAGLVAPTL